MPSRNTPVMLASIYHTYGSVMGNGFYWIQKALWFIPAGNQGVGGWASVPPLITAAMVPRKKVGEWSKHEQTNLYLLASMKPSTPSGFDMFKCFNPASKY